MGSVNKAILVGNLGRDAETTVTTKGFSIARFSLATTHRRKNAQSGEWEEKTEWHKVVILGKQAESLRDYLKKGKQIYVDGRIETRSWDDKDGQKKYMTEIVAETVQLLGGGGGGGARSGRSGGDDYDYGGGSSGGGGGDFAPPPVDDDVPF